MTVDCPGFSCIYSKKMIWYDVLIVLERNEEHVNCIKKGKAVIVMIMRTWFGDGLLM